jgi:aspartate kinase
MELRRALDDDSVAVAPGFFATLASGMLVSLGRGGSDLSAVLFAKELRAEQCELIKDVPGYFSEDPHVHGEARHIPQLTYDKALAMAERGCELVQPRALEAARHARLRLVVRSMDDCAPASTVSEDAAVA